MDRESRDAGQGDPQHERQQNRQRERRQDKKRDREDGERPCRADPVICLLLRGVGEADDPCEETDRADQRPEKVRRADDRRRGDGASGQRGEGVRKKPCRAHDDGAEDSALVQPVVENHGDGERDPGPA